MTQAQAIIIAMIGEGKRNIDIVRHTGKTTEYVSQIRRRLIEDPQLCENPAALEAQLRMAKQIKARIRQMARAAEKARAEVEARKLAYYAGEVSCLCCDRKFFSKDRRYNRICARCSRSNLPHGGDGVLSNGGRSLGKTPAMTHLDQER